MRKILFRGKRTDNGEWVEGAYFHPANTIISYQHELIDDVNTFKDFIVIPETVGQFTGVTDKNGTPIFEGDIVRINAREVYEIGYIEKYTRFAGKRKGVVFGAFCFRKCEIIGNAHENPELLEANK